MPLADQLGREGTGLESLEIVVREGLRMALTLLITVPGVLKLVAELWKDLGRLPGIPEGVHKSLREPKCVLVSRGSLPPGCPGFLTWSVPCFCNAI